MHVHVDQVEETKGPPTTLASFLSSPAGLASMGRLALRASRTSSTATTRLCRRSRARAFAERFQLDGLCYQVAPVALARAHWSITGTVNMPFNIKVPLMCVTRPVTRYGRSTGRLTGC